MLTDTTTRLENDVEAQKEKQDESTEIINEKAVDLENMLKNTHMARVYLFEWSSDKSKYEEAQAVSDNYKDNFWNHIKHNIGTCHRIVSKELIASKTHEDILKRFHTNVKVLCSRVPQWQNISLTTEKAQGKGNFHSLVVRVRPASNLIWTAWDCACQLAYQSTNENIPSEDEHGGIHTDTDKKTDVRKQSPAKAKGRPKAPSE
ncbi:uncharacterized protein HD556DRAFT_1310901 [Suillus plorans]|uniref:Uncharacterized protein n=1 Tax=Suillus plorans TaxID=116603 RepID=A0A9P7AK01_9AGAM|nr:uncharacterized protein HD556DRAFT_1310901 [Suillus plorans]KAG1790118.1 hypothetical protein HD556DRAFT_1310901 [Suillus plorans]